MNSEQCKVLVVDEDRDNADTTAMLLHLWGHEAEAAYSPEDALSKATAFDPDVILVDLGRPVTNGFDLAGQLRGLCPEARLLAITGFTAGDIVRRSRNAGFEKVLIKPAPASRVQEAVESECATKQSNG